MSGVEGCGEALGEGGFAWVGWGGSVVRVGLVGWGRGSTGTGDAGDGDYFEEELAIVYMV